MKKTLITLTGVLSIGAVLPAVAGPDWQLIEQGRKAKAARMQQAQAQQEQAPPQSDQRAQMRQMMETCMEMMKKN